MASEATTLQELYQEDMLEYLYAIHRAMQWSDSDTTRFSSA